VLYFKYGNGTQPNQDIMNTTAIGILAGLIIPAIWICSFSAVSEPQRRQVNCILVGLAASTYGNHSFGLIESAGTITVLTLGILGLHNYRWLGAAWLVHTGLDIAHHLVSDPMFRYFPASSLGCAVTDPILALWFFAEAPDIRDVIKRLRAKLVSLSNLQ
jgi:hypothetical protein